MHFDYRPKYRKAAKKARKRRKRQIVIINITVNGNATYSQVGSKSNVLSLFSPTNSTYTANNTNEPTISCWQKLLNGIKPMITCCFRIKTCFC